MREGWRLCIQSVVIAFDALYTWERHIGNSLWILYLNRKIHCSFLNYHDLIQCITHRWSPFAVPSTGRIHHKHAQCSMEQNGSCRKNNLTNDTNTEKNHTEPDYFQGTPNMAPKLIQKRPVRNGAPGSSASLVKVAQKVLQCGPSKPKQTSLTWFQVLLAFCFGKKCCQQISSG